MEDLDVVFIQHITAAFQQVGGANALQDAKMNREEVTLVLTRMFNGVSQELPGHVTAAGSEETGSLMFRLFERFLGPVQQAVCLVSLSGDGSGSITRSGLRSLLQDLNLSHRLLEQQLGAWRLTIQSEQGVLEDRCSEMEVTVETMRQHNVRLQDMLTQALRKMEAKHANNTPQSFITQHTDRGNVTPTSDSLTDAEEEELLKEKDDWSQNEPQTPSPTIPHQSTVSQDELFHEEELNEKFNHQPIGQQGEPEGVGLQTNVPFLSDREDLGMCSPEDLLQKIVARLKMEMEDKWTERNTGVGVKAELVEAAEQVGDSVCCLVDAVRQTDQAWHLESCLFRINN
ncbi:hypothetical protein GOODEAATRI_011706 [Goodea atripinnis]|uniref:Uncharacterized protein n=1 Tax=Goodea atripinnis TaxID=208336 RepID=A0ABV0N9V9_9TELE